MKLWKFIGLAVLALTLAAFIGCGEAEKKAEPKTEPVVEEMVAVDYTPTAEEIGTEVTCAACGMTMAVAAETPAAEYDGVAYYFCTPEEKADFIADPKKYLNKAEEAPAETETEGESSGH